MEEIKNQETEKKSFWSSIPKKWQNVIIGVGIVATFGIIIAIVVGCGA